MTEQANEEVAQQAATFTPKVGTPPAFLRDAATIYEQRNKLYGDNYKHFGPSLSALFPNGLTVKSPHDFNRLGLLVQVFSKLTRYAQNFERGGHEDSLDDLAVYAMMLKEIDRGVKK